ncbi:class E sortase [Protaetiibacter mangrovi]|uniref:Class E sortase n=1 Tax=Protaetiibacter mangrovi TaxID=2970926 RepID=A0ABT1ZHC8_9MICO|nr:class E sortase [Protaetiibacter mangrovi]MCS0500109.1 class E sortase [Protaetiibacter mangrovi]TPX03255.1 class E sortase [Schumannella luteola]
MSAGPETAPSVPAVDGGRRSRREHERRRARRGRRTSVVGVLGELLITAGLVVLLYIVWQLWISEYLVGNEVKQQAGQLSQEWNEQAQETPTPSATPSPSTSATPEPSEDPEPVDTVIPVGTAPAVDKNFAILMVPRWGSDYARTIAEGVGTADVLDKGKLGHYPSTQMPGAVGNFAIAAHRMGHGGSLHHINELQLGDHIFVETADGWYQYSFRNLEYVHPTGVGVLDAVPQSPETPATERYITLTSCNPQYTSRERIIAYGVFDRFYPRDPSAPDKGAPAEIAATVNGAG